MLNKIMLPVFGRNKIPAVLRILDEAWAPATARGELPMMQTVTSVDAVGQSARLVLSLRVDIHTLRLALNLIPLHKFDDL